MTNSNFFVEILFDSTLIKLSTQKKFMMQSRPGAAGGHFGGPTPPKITPCALPKSVLVPRKKVTGPVPLECILGPVPPKAWVKFRSRKKKHAWTQRLSLRFRAEDLYFGLHPWVSGQKARSAPLDSVVPLRARFVPRKKVNSQAEDLFLVFTPEDEGKIYLHPLIFFLPPQSPTLAPGLMQSLSQ